MRIALGLILALTVGFRCRLSSAAHFPGSNSGGRDGNGRSS
jgi:hypothetical protein